MNACLTVKKNNEILSYELFSPLYGLDNLSFTGPRFADENRNHTAQLCRLMTRKTGQKLLLK